MADDVRVTVDRDDAYELLELLGERPYPERWSARIYVALANALNLPIPSIIARDAAA